MNTPDQPPSIMEPSAVLSTINNILNQYVRKGHMKMESKTLRNYQVGTDNQLMQIYINAEVWPESLDRGKYLFLSPNNSQLRWWSNIRSSTNCQTIWSQGRPTRAIHRKETRRQWNYEQCLSVEFGCKLFVAG
jgi:hypothetical protein